MEDVFHARFLQQFADFVLFPLISGGRSLNIDTPIFL